MKRSTSPRGAKTLLTLAAAALALGACQPEIDAPTAYPDTSHVRIEQTDVQSYDLVVAHIDDVRTYGALIVVEGGTIATFERDDTALLLGGGQVLPLAATRTAHTLDVAAGTTVPVDIDEARLLTFTVTPDGERDDVSVRVDLSGNSHGVITSDGARADLQNLSGGLDAAVR